VAVIGVKDEKWGERPVALVVLKAGAPVVAIEEDIRQHVLAYSESGQISKYAVPQIIRIVEALEKTSIGKVNKKLIREHFTA
jgi:fatty-acyl-CoA synthase